MSQTKETMRIYLDGWGYAIQDLTKDDVIALLKMIKGAGLCQRRNFNGLKQQIEELNEKGLLTK